jgi:hypothetical protein
VPPMFAWLHVDEATVASLRGSLGAIVPPSETPPLWGTPTCWPCLRGSDSTR